jgi:3-oxoadipate enol-lactonase
VKIDLNSGPLNYLSMGTGPTVLLLHAFPLNHTMWEPQFESLSASFQVIAPDIHGFGESQPPSPWTMASIADDLNEFLEKLGIDECAVVGVSMGGYIALSFWNKYPKRFRQLILSNTRARADSDAEKAGRNDMIAALEQYGSAVLAERMLSRLLKPNPAPEVAERVRKIVETTQASAAIHALSAMRERPDSSILLHRLGCPTMVITGAEDVMIRVEDSRAMADVIPGSRFMRLPNSGHLSNLENPEEYNRALLGFLT